MNGLRLFALLTYTFGAFTYGALVLLWARELGRVGWGGRGSDGDRSAERRVDLLNGALTIVSFAWFCVLIVQILIAVAGVRSPYWPVEVAILFLAYSFPPLIMHVTWAEASRRHPVAGPRPWRAAIALAYFAAVAIPSVFIVLALQPGEMTGAYRLASTVLNAGLSVLFIAAAVFSIVLISRAPRSTRPDKAGHHWPMLTLFGLMLMVFATIFIIEQIRGGAGRVSAVGSPVEVLARSLPLLFVFVSTYYENRFQFFDIFVKRGFSLLVTIGLLTLWFAVTLPVLAPLTTNSAAAWLFALALLPVVALAPWLHAQIGTLLDRRWLGRRFSTVEAVTRFLSALRSATSEADAIARAAESLSEIFRAPALVTLGEAPVATDFVVQHEAVVRSPQGADARFLLGPRATDAPYFSQDVALVRSLADVFGSILDNLRLQQHRLEQEQRAQEMTLSASRSELKALRAQINPHFLFNALNAIAGLIHRNPAVADRTIEKLADVFRYALRGAENEWALLEDELEFVRAYLDVEQARFGDRLVTSVHVDDAARSARLPTMIVQTLVENAVKHGASTVRGRASIDVRASVEDGRLRIDVSDNGPGFGAAGAMRNPRDRGGYGLANIRQRLAGYFDTGAGLDVARDTAQGRTVVTVTLPLLTTEPVRTAGATR